MTGGHRERVVLQNLDSTKLNKKSKRYVNNNLKPMKCRIATSLLIIVEQKDLKNLES